MLARVEIGTLLGGTYRIVRRIGSGGMGEVYEATHERLAHRYAIKFLHPGVRDHPEALPRFMREAQVTSQLRHPGIVSVVDFNTLPGGVAYLVMEYLEGEPLGKMLTRTGPLPIARVVDITDQLSSALTAAHRQGVVHRDMHPQNVFVVPGVHGERARIKILDFGISKIASVSQKITGMAAVLGTPQYMSPEQAEGKTDELDAASDQFSLATIVYEMLTGRPAFAGETLASVAYQVVHGQPAPIRRFRPELSVEIENVVARGMAKNKKDRFPSVAELAMHLRWTAKLSTGEIPVPPEDDPDGPAEEEFGKEETTAVSALPSGMAAVLRETSSGLPARNDLLPPPAGESRGAASAHDELTVVQPPDHRVATHPEGEDPGADLRPRRRRMVAGMAVAGGLLVLAVAVGLSMRGRAPSAPGPSNAARPPGRAAAPAAGATPAAGEEGGAEVEAEVADTRAEAEGAGPRPEEPSGARRAAARTRGRTGTTGKVPASAPDPSPGVAEAGECRLTVGTFPWSELWIDGKDTGQQTPVVGLRVPCGSHRLQFKRRDLSIEQTENVQLIEGHDFKRQYELRGAALDD